MTDINHKRVIMQETHKKPMTLLDTFITIYYLIYT